MRKAANTISYIFHPIILVYALVYLAFGIDRYSYYISGSKEIGVMFIMNFVLLVLLPFVGIAMLVGLKMISGFKMPEREDRIGPLLITLSFYIWYFINIKNNAAFPDTLRFVALGATIAVALAFFINNFSKISLHAIGGSALLTAVIILVFHTEAPFLDLNLGIIGSYRLSAIFVILICIIIAGAVGSARLYLKAHQPQEIYGGYLVGAVAQIVAFRIMMI